MEKNGGSRLLQMQARFQQKQLQEREMKIASLYEAQQARALTRVRHSPSNGVVSSPSPPPAATPLNHQPGKVRQMFEERRTKAGIDKSYPLQPIHTNGARKPLPNGYTKVTTPGSRVTVERKSKTLISSSTHSLQKHTAQKIEHNIVNGSGDLNHNHEADMNTIKRVVAESSRVVQNGNGVVQNGDVVDKVDKDNNYLLENETFPEAMAPAATPRSPDHGAQVKKLVRKSPATVKSSPMKTKPQLHSSTPPRKVTSENGVSENNKSRAVMPKTINPVSRKTPSVSNISKSRAGGVTGGPGSAGAEGGAGGEPCAVCGRRFAPDRLDKHQAICAKAHAKKRKPFDALKHRIAGTEAEQFVSKGRKGVTAVSASKAAKPLNSNWRQKHEEFIAAIRAAKQVQAHLSAGGKLSDLPPPPPSENPDYVQCPHCNRRFNQGAAERHIPKCASYQFNKPKPTASRRR